METLTHFHFIVYCAMDDAGGIFQRNTVVDVIAPDERTALARAKLLAPGRNVYFVQSVVEHHPHATQ